MATFSDPSRSPIGPWHFIDEYMQSEENSIFVPVVNLILTMIGCIILKIDHGPMVQNFKDVLSDKNLQIIRNDLENLLYFEEKDAVSMLLNLIKRRRGVIDGKATPNCCNASTSKSSTSRNFPKYAMKRVVLNVVRFLIFRRVKSRSDVSRVLFDSNIRDTCEEKTEGESGNDLFAEEVVTSSSDLRMETNVKKKDCFGYCKEHMRKEFENVCTECALLLLINGEDSEKVVRRCNTAVSRNTFNPATPSDTEPSDSLDGDTSFYWDCESCTSISESAQSGHCCNKIHCPLCYGWLWVIFYCTSIVLYPVAINLAYCIPTGIHILFK